MESEDKINLLREKIINDMELLTIDLNTIHLKLDALRILLDLIDSIK